MKQKKVLVHEFVEFIPDVLEEGKIYVSMEYATVVHKCCCGCGKEVVTPLSPTDWKLIFDGKTISLDPSVGNWSSPCKSHYWIRKNRVAWARRWSQEEIDAGRTLDRRAKREYFEATDATADDVRKNVGSVRNAKIETDFWRGWKRWWSKRTGTKVR
ncbi:MAG TPA: DUF6527 family protein [Terriglobales bacterium]|nr:DUF6527 family protein [Terriglobales bacterium]